jgi:hypothetical protein
VVDIVEPHASQFRFREQSVEDSVAAGRGRDTREGFSPGLVHGIRWNLSPRLISGVARRLHPLFGSIGLGATAKGLKPKETNL